MRCEKCGEMGAANLISHIARTRMRENFLCLHLHRAHACRGDTNCREFPKAV